MSWPSVGGRRSASGSASVLAASGTARGASASTPSVAHSARRRWPVSAASASAFASALSCPRSSSARRARSCGGEGSLASRGHDAFARRFGQARDEFEAEAHRGSRPVSARRFQRAVPVADRDVDRPDLHAVVHRIAHDLRRRVEAERLRVEQCGAERGRLVALQPRRHVHQQSEARRVALRKTVFAEALDLLVDLLGVLGGVAARQHAADQLVAERPDAALALPRGHRAPQLVGLARREAGGDHRQLHHLLLEDRHAERALEHGLHRFRRIGHRLELLPPPQVRMHHAALDRPRPHDRRFDHQIVEAARRQPRQHVHLRARLDLEHAQRIAPAQHVVHLRALRRDVLQLQPEMGVRDGFLDGHEIGVRDRFLEIRL
jgi:hypothetical protein